MIARSIGFWAPVITIGRRLFWISAGKLVCMATQVTHEGSDMEVYQVGKVIKEKFPVLESYDMTLEASVTKMMWVLGQTQDIEECRKLFYKTINHDMLFV